MILKASTILVLSVLLIATHQEDSMIIISNSEHQAIYNSEQLQNFIEKSPSAQTLEFELKGKQDFDDLRQIIRNKNIHKSRVSSFQAKSNHVNNMKGQLSNKGKSQFQKINFTALEEKLNDLKYDMVIHMKTQETTRKLQESGSSSQVSPSLSLLFDSMSNNPAILSGILVSVFLLIMLGIALSCLMDIKTNDRFARNNLWVGKES